jgi:prepilin-type N-terminal cleavage/methylation domain-containing protein
MMRAYPMQDRRGMTLPEMMMALTVFSIAMGGAMAFLASQQKAFQKGSDALNATQNLSFALTTLAQEIRTAGANVPAGQPTVVYAGNNSFSFNTDIVTNVANDPFATYYDPDAPSGQVTSLRLANQITVPGSSPNRTYPLQDYFVLSGSASVPSNAETITFWFELDSESARTDDYRLMRQVNSGGGQLLSRNVLPPADTAARFFSYRYLYTPATGRQTILPVPTAWMPVSFASANGRSDSLRAVTINYRVTNGLSGTAERINAVTFTVGLPNVGLTRLQQCGDSPAYSGTFSASWNATDLGVALSFPASVDEASGERDVVRYVVWRKVNGAAEWGEPYLSIPTGSATYTYLDQAVDPSTTYVYAVAAQDCTPRLSSQLTSSTVSVP